MALQGTLKDFGLADIFQLIGIQRKTGTLTLENDEDTVTVRFSEGQVVGADTRLRNLEDLLGSVLVRTGRITEAQLQDALKVQNDTLQRLGYVLVEQRFISEEDLREALLIQVTQMVYRLFRWREGRYHFDPQPKVEFEKLFQPIGAETILMEGARMIDEWPIIERKIRSEKMVFRRAAAAARVAGLEGAVESIIDQDLDLELSLGAGAEARTPDPEISLSPEERDILRMVDGRASVQEIVDRSALGEFDTYRILYELLTRNLVEEVKVVASGVAAGAVGRAGVWVSRGLVGVVLLASLLAVATLDRNPLTPWKLAASNGSTDQLRGYASRVRLERIEEAIRVFYLDMGTVPTGLDSLATGGYLEQADLLDPWGRTYGFELASGGYRLFGFDAAGDPDEDLKVDRKFSASQRMMLDGAISTPTSGG